MMPQRRQLANGREYKITDTGLPYVVCDRSDGGLVVHAIDPRFSVPVYIDNVADDQQLEQFMKALERLPPLEKT